MRSFETRMANSESQIALIGFGNPLLDIQFSTDEAFLEKYGLAAGGFCFQEDRQRGIYEELRQKSTVEYIPGGATMNSLRVYQGLTGKAGKVFFMGCIGNDAFGEQLRELCDKDGLRTSFLVSDKNPTGVCGVVVVDKERSLCTRLGAANDFEQQHLQKSENMKKIAEASYCYVAGFVQTVCPDGISFVAKQFAEAGKIFCSSLSATFLIEHCKDHFLNLLPYVDILFGNEDEYLHWSRVHEMNETDLCEIARRIASMPKHNPNNPRVVVVTQGVHPTLVATRWSSTTTSTVYKVTQYPVAPLDPEKIVDSNGAGDAFVGGFIFGLDVAKQRGHPFSSSVSVDLAVHFAHVAARHIVQRSGCRFNFDPEELKIPEAL